MKPFRSAYLCLSQAAFLAACLFGPSYALSYLRFVRENNWQAWSPGLGIALLFAAMVMAYVGQMRPLVGTVVCYLGQARHVDQRRYFHWCWVAYILALCPGLVLAMNCLGFVHENSWTGWKPGVGIALLFLSLNLSYIGFAWSEWRGRQSLFRSVETDGAFLA